MSQQPTARRLLFRGIPVMVILSRPKHPYYKACLATLEKVIAAWRQLGDENKA